MDRYTRRQLYAVVSDVSSYESFVPFCTRSRILRPLAHAPTPATPNAQQMEAELTVAFLAFTERYTSRVTCVPCESVRVCLRFFLGLLVYIGNERKPFLSFLFIFLTCLWSLEVD